MKANLYKKQQRSLLLSLCGILSVVSLFFTGCAKWDTLKSPDEGTIYMAQAYSDRSELKIFKIDQPQTFTFGASVAGFKGAQNNTDVEFEVDNSLLSQFNKGHAYLGYDFVPLPDDAYSISDLSTTIEQGKQDSKPLSFSIQADKLDPSVDYCLPIKIKSVSNGTIDTSLNVSYFMIDSLYIRSRDVTGQGKLSVSKENNGGADATEGSVRLTDNDYTTKFLYEFESDSWMQLKLDSAIQLNAYTLTSGNDAPERDPKNWEIQGSKDGNTWTTLDERTDYAFTSRRQTITFEFNKPDGKAYQYYRFLVHDTNGSNLFQLTEWRLLQYY